ncbi:nucleotide sugar dehydrogenase (plasmid) [Pedobacter sp. BS3]|uniref:nucleotide sugar dehydrogenase n=1 Tax=Pedobacter sp. BS3 TaxID=2567937 RepID=UPI0011EFF643|nr:nucleotide sugar dehydrogenase [Pedobacter sp. BS3]TZF86434.1 nucleotide sugar dehydrogenase [Pedobacter sp. BS3]
MHSDISIAVIGLGYVGLPLSLAFAKKYPVKGYDINEKRIRDLENGHDSTNQVSGKALQDSHIYFTSDINTIADCNVYIITVPTPVDHSKKPDLAPLLQASQQVGNVLKKGDVVIYESTVYPGCTEEDCIPVLEEASGLSYNHDFFCGYSPERISPGDELHTLESIVKITSGSTPETAAFVDELYASIITAGTYKAPSIKVAEAAKAIENAQRDVNISFVNELSLICDKIGIDTTDVIEAAATKWNFLKFKPGLVGGHCIGVDPYYLAHKAESLGYHPEVILSGRRVNDYISTFIVNKVVKLMIEKGSNIKQSGVLVLGITFKENCPDIRNSKVVDIYRELQQFGMMVDVYDPCADKSEVQQQYNIDLIDDIYAHNYHAVILAVAHKEFLAIDFARLKQAGAIIYDTKSVIDRRWVDARL